MQQWCFSIQHPFQKQTSQNRQCKDRDRRDLVGAAKYEKQEQCDKGQDRMHADLSRLTYCRQILQPEQQCKSEEQE